MKNNKLNDTELKQMFTLLKRYSETDMDQWDSFKFDSNYGMVYIDILREKSGSEEQYIDVSKLINEKKS